MKNLSIFTVLITALIITSCSKDQAIQEPAIPVMAYYMPRNNYPAQDIPVEKLTHVIFSFTEVIDNRMVFPDKSMGDKLETLVDQKERNPGLKVMVACGGWGGSGGFSDMAADPDNRNIFVKSVIEFINNYNLDGLDVDWEYPGLPGIGNPYRPEDRQNFTSLMKEIREAMDETGRKLTLTFAAAGWNMYFDNIEPSEVMKYADYMNLMTYDFIGGATPYTAHHTNLGNIDLEDLKGSDLFNYARDSILAKYDSTWHPRSIEYIVDYCTGIGIDPGQLIIGAAFYGKSWKVSEIKNNGLYQPAAGSQQGWPSYADIRKKMESKNGFTRYWDEKAMAPWLFNDSDSLFITYDDTLSVKLKTRYVIDNKLGGIMFWEQSQDTRDGNGLLDAIYDEAIKGE